MRKIVLCFMAILVLFVGCGKKESKEATTEGKEVKTIGIAMPTKSSQRWIDDGNNMVKEFEALGYKVDLQYAEDVVENQVSQIENMISKKVDALVVAPIDGESLSNVLEAAVTNNIPVVSYDRLIKNTPAVSYYATFDNFQVGVLQGTYIVDKLDLKNAKGPFYAEVFAGSPDDNNANYFFDGAMSILKPFIESGKLIIGSKQTEFSQAATLRWDGATAQARMDNLLSAYYTDKKINAVLSPYDGISIGIVSSLKGVGYGKADQLMPIITGQDAELPSIKSIITGEQTSTVFKDTRALAKRAVVMVDAILNDKMPEVNDTKTYNNGSKVVPSFLEKPVSVDKDNYKDILVGSGYYTEDELK